MELGQQELRAKRAMELETSSKKCWGNWKPPINIFRLHKNSFQKVLQLLKTPRGKHIFQLQKTAEGEESKGNWKRNQHLCQDPNNQMHLQFSHNYWAKITQMEQGYRLLHGNDAASSVYHK